MTINLNIPKVVGKMDAGIFKTLQRDFPDRECYFDVISGEVDRNGDPHSLRTNLAMFALLRPLFDCYVRLFGSQRFIGISVDTTRVAPRTAQRGGGFVNQWHVDEGGRGIAVSNALPTEFVVNDGRAKLDGSQQTRRKAVLAAGTWGLTGQADENLPDIGLKIHRPKPLEIVELTNHPHRSACNTTSRTIERGWVRVAGEK